LEITQVTPGKEGICGHPIAINRFLGYLKSNVSEYKPHE